MKAGPKTIGSLGFGGILKPGTRPSAIKDELEELLKLGGNFVEMVPGAEQIVGEVITEMQVRRDDLILSTTFPRKLDPYLEEIPLTFKSNVHFTVDPFRKEMAKNVELSPEEAEMHPLLFRLEQQLQINFDVSKQTLDVVLVDLDSLRAELEAKEDYTFDRLLEQTKVVFQALQTKVTEGEIIGYGMASSHFASKVTSPSDLDLSRLLDIAGPDLRFVSAPVNLCDSRFVTAGSSRKSPLDLAREKGLCVLATRPLDSTDSQGCGFFLETLPPTDKTGALLSHELKGAFNHACQFERSAVDLYRRVREVNSEFDFESACWGHTLGEHPNFLKDPVLWKRALNYWILPRLHVALNQLALDPKIIDWVEAYRACCLHLFAKYTEAAEFGERDVLQSLSRVAGTPLEQQALAVVLNSGVDCVLTTHSLSVAKRAAQSQIAPEDVTRILRECAKFGPQLLGDGKDRSSSH